MLKVKGSSVVKPANNQLICGCPHPAGYVASYDRCQEALLPPPAWSPCRHSCPDYTCIDLLMSPRPPISCLPCTISVLPLLLAKQILYIIIIIAIHIREKLSEIRYLQYNTYIIYRHVCRTLERLGPRYLSSSSLVFIQGLICHRIGYIHLEGQPL